MTRLRPHILVLAALALLAGPPAARTDALAAAPPAAPASARTERQAFLEMFARAYFPGRSGQVMVVPREGDILTRKGADVPFMHGSPWSYDTRIPMIFWGARYVRPGRYLEPAAQQDVAPTLGRTIDLVMPGVTGRVTVTLPAGQQTLTIDQDNGGWNIHQLTFA